MENLVAGDLQIDVGQDAIGGPIKLVWKGKSNDRHPGKIFQPFFARILDVAGERGAAIEMHFQQLEHFNSSTITAIIQLIQEARSKGIKLVILFDASLKWQKLSFDALRVFAKGNDLLELRSP